MSRATCRREWWVGSGSCEAPNAYSDPEKRPAGDRPARRRYGPRYPDAAPLSSRFPHRSKAKKGATAASTRRSPSFFVAPTRARDRGLRNGNNGMVGARLVSLSSTWFVWLMMTLDVALAGSSPAGQLLAVRRSGQVGKWSELPVRSIRGRTQPVRLFVPAARSFNGINEKTVLHGRGAARAAPSPVLAWRCCG